MRICVFLAKNIKSNATISLSYAHTHFFENKKKCVLVRIFLTNFLEKIKIYDVRMRVLRKKKKKKGAERKPYPLFARILTKTKSNSSSFFLKIK